MKKFAVAIVLWAGLVLVGCGSNDKPANINGNWTAMLTDSNGNTVFAFTTSLIEKSDGTLNVTKFSFSTNSECFVSGETESGSFALTGNFNGNVTGNLQFNVASGSPSGNTLQLSGTASGNTISGTWSLTGGSGCNGSGNFTMTRS